MTRRARRVVLGVVVVAAAVLVVRACRVTSPYSHAQILEAIRLVESGDRADPPDGDGGKAIGPYQIHRAYWVDAVAAEPALARGGRGYQSCRDRAYAERVIAAYMRRYVPEAWAARDAQTIARVHNGGPRGPEKPSTRGYWLEVRRALEDAVR